MMPLALQPELNTGSSVYGTTRYYAFAETLGQNTSYASIYVTGSGAHTFEVSNTAFVVPSMTQMNGSLLDITIATRMPISSITVDVSAPTGQRGTIAPRIVRQGVSVAKTTQTTVSGYQLWHASLELGLQLSGAVAVKAVANGPDQVEDVLYLSSGAAGW